MKKSFPLLALLVISVARFSPAYAHDGEHPVSPPLLDGFHLYGGVGLLHNYGEIKEHRLIPVRRHMNENMPGFTFSLQKNLTRAVSLKGMLLFGQLQGTKRELTLVSDVVTRGAYFHSHVSEATLGVHLDFERLFMPWVLDPFRKWRFMGYTTIGFTRFQSQIYSLKTKEAVKNLQKGIANTGKTTEVVVPVGLQAGYRIGNNFEANIEFSLRFMGTDKLDGWIEPSSHNDKYSFVGLGLTYSFGPKKNLVNKEAEKVSHNFSVQDIMKMWKAQKAFKEKNYVVGLALYQELYKNNQNNAFLNYRIGLSHLNLKNSQESISFLRRAHQLDPYVDPEIHLKMGQAFHQEGELDSAMTQYQLYRQLINPDKLDENIVNTYISQVWYAREQMAKPVDVTIRNLSDKINTQYPEYSPSVTADGKTLIFTSRRPNTTGKSIDINDHGYYEDIYISHFNDSTHAWNQAEGIKGALNTDYHDAALSISPDGHDIYVYKNTPNRTRSGDIFVSHKGETGRWSAPENLGKDINSSYFETAASVTPDGKTLYFVSERKNGYGRGDIYKSYRDENNVRHVENLGPVINTSEDEISVYIHPDGKTLYFSSRGHKGMGGYDIFRSVYENGQWSEPENLGYPINTTDDNVHFILTTDGKKAYYASVEKDGLGDNDIYEIDMSRYVLPSQMNNQVKPEKVELAILEGQVKDSQTGKPVNAEMVIVDEETGEKVASFQAGQNGMYFMTLVANKPYRISLNHELYLEKKTEISTEVPEDTVMTFVSDFMLERKEKLPDDVTPELFEVKNIQFKFEKGSSKLVIIDSSVAELNKLIDYMKRVKSFTIEISGHTDNSGSPEFNYKLSKERAQVVGDYFSKNGIEKGRILVQGFGADKPVADNQTEEGRSKNRRVEVRIVE
ncbi:MAG: PD40 domain-containing protein [Flavobacteriales bacterium]|nr:PD40 domain-containing protein [Flavobacteriales bacterium]MCB9447608.1 PD40 domain-containing protein [Flavobacteriales bacterium]